MAALVNAQAFAVTRLIDVQLANVGQRLAALRAGDGGAPTASGPGLWAPASAPRAQAHRAAGWLDTNFVAGSQAGVLDRSAVAFGSTTLTGGVDLRASDRLTIGAGLGFGRDAADVGSGHGQRERGTSTDLTLYGSQRLGGDGFVDALVGVGTFGFDTVRFDSPLTPSVLGARVGSERFASIGSGRRFTARRLRIAPSAGVTVISASLRPYTETGAGAAALTFGEETTANVYATAGVLGDYRVATGLGTVTPRFGVEYARRLSADGSAPVWYADTPTVRFAVPAGATDTRPLTLSVGATAQFQHGLLFNVDYRAVIDRQAVQHGLRIGLSTKL